MSRFFSKESSYSPREEVSSPPRLTAGESSSELNAFLGRGCEFEGKLTFEGTVRIDGRVTGEIFSNDVLVIGQSAEIHAEIDVGVAIVSGNVRGNITARSRLELHAPARVIGNIVCAALTVQDGVYFEGNCRMDVAAAKSKPGSTVGAASADDVDMDTFDLSKYEAHS